MSKTFIGLNSNPSVPCRRTLKKRILEEYESQQLKLKADLENVAGVCTTAEVWSARRRSFMGVTCHWITKDFQRKSILLSLQRFPGKHTSDKIAELLSKVFSSYCLNDKIISVITDNGTNFCKAFRDYQVKTAGAHDDEGIEEAEDDDSTIESEDTCAILEEATYLSLPPHYRCVSHTLSLVATTDLNSVHFFFSINQQLSNI